MTKKKVSLQTYVINTPIMIGYGMGFFGYGFVTQMISSYFVFYATAVLMLPGSFIGTLVAISIIWDAVSDPIMGFISDHTKSKYGNRHIYIFIGTILIAFGNLFLWNVKLDLSSLQKFVWLLIAIMMVKTFVTIFVTPYSALGAELTTDYNERSKLQSIKTIWFLSALIIVTAVCMFIFFRPTALYPVGQLNPLAYRNIAITSSIVMVISGAVTLIFTNKYKTEKHKKNTASTKHFIYEIKRSLENLNFRKVFFGYLFTNMASAIIGVVGLHTFTYTFSMNNYKVGIVLGTQIFVSIISQPLWIAIAKRIDKKKTVLLGLFISIFGCVILFIAVLLRNMVSLNYQYLLIYATIIGFGTSGLYTIPLSMVTDTVDQEEYIHETRSEGVYFGMLNFGYKMSQSIAIFILGILLDLIRFNPNLSIQSHATSIHLGVALSLGSLIAFTLAIIAYFNYTLDENEINKIQIELLIRRNKRSMDGEESKF